MCGDGLSLLGALREIQSEKTIDRRREGEGEGEEREREDILNADHSVSDVRESDRGHATGLCITHVPHIQTLTICRDLRDKKDKVRK